MQFVNGTEKKTQIALPRFDLHFFELAEDPHTTLQEWRAADVTALHS